MESKDELLLLFASLSGSEKRYLRIRLDREGDAQLIGLYEAIVNAPAGKTLDRINAHLPDPKIRSRARRKLYDLLLDGLTDFELKHNPDLQIYRNIQRAKVLLLRELHPNAEKLLRKTLAEAMKYDRKGPIALISELQCNQESLLKATRKKDAPRDALFQQSYLTAKEYADLRSYYYKDAMVTMTFNHEGAVGEGAGNFLTNIREEALQATMREGFFFPYLGLNILANLSLLTADQEAQQETWNSLVNHFESHPHMISGISTGYIRVLHYNALMAIAAGDAVLAAECLNKLREKKPGRASSQPYWVQLYYCTLGQYAMNVGDEAAIRRFVEEAAQQLPLHIDKMHGVYALLLKLLLAVCHFMLGNFREALHWVHENLNEESTFSALKSQQILATLRLFIYVELGEMDTLEMMLEKTRTLLGKKVPFPRFWKLCQEYFLALIKGDPNLSPEKALRQFVSASEALFSEPAETNVQAHFDFPAWGRARLEGIPFRTYIADHFGPPS